MSEKQRIRIEQLEAENEKLKEALKKIKALDSATNAASLESDYDVIMDTAEEALKGQ
jgi:cell shape-determining protein MreC